MKKNYITPSTALVEVHSRYAMMMVSNRITSGSGEDGSNVWLNPGTMQEGDGSDAAARGFQQHSVWDD